MEHKIGRNDPCHCGSGKKYKKCHLAEDQAREHQQLAAAAASARAAWTPPPPLEPLPVLPSLPPHPPPTEAELQEERENAAFWEAFDAAGYEGRLRIFDEQLAGDADAERAFDMLETLYQDTSERGEPARFREMVGRLRARAPDAYARDRIWYHSWMIEGAVAAREYVELPALVAPLGEVAAEAIDETFRLIDLLLFHDQVGPLLDMMTRAWPSVSASKDILPYGIAEFAATLTLLQIIDHLRRGGAARADDPRLREALEPLGRLDEGRIALTLEVLSHPGARSWTADDFVHDRDHLHEPEEDTIAEIDSDEIDGPDAFEPFGDAADESDEHAGGGCETLGENVYALSLDWAATMAREGGVPLARTEVARETLIEYLMGRPPLRDRHAPLLPDRRSVDALLVALLSPLSGLYYKGGTFFALLPAFIEFLEARGLARHDAARRARADILKLRPHVLRLVEAGTTDAALHELVRDA